MKSRDKPSDSMKFARLAAHQLKGPVSSASMLLKTILGEFAGPLNHQQKVLIQKAIARCDQALESVQRTLAIARAGETGNEKNTIVDLASLAHKIENIYLDEARRDHKTFLVDCRIESPLVRGYEPALTEVIEAMVSNAFKYTPNHGRIRLAIDRDLDRQAILISVADSGVGIPEKDREKVFQPFYRTARAADSSRPGTGLGLAFVKSAVEAAGGCVGIRDADLGGADIWISLPVAPGAQIETQKGGDMNAPMRVVIVGGAVAGPKAASKIIRLCPDAQVTIVEKNQFLACAGCGLPYFIAGVVEDPKGLLSTPAGTLRDAVFFQSIKHIRVLNQTEAIAIDRNNHAVRIRDAVSNKENALPYDKLVLATGALPSAPAIPGANLTNVIHLHGLISAERIRTTLGQGGARDVVIVGGGILGVEITESLVARGCRVTIVEREDQLLPILDWEMATLVERHLESKGVRILTQTKIESLQGDEKVKRVLTDKGELPADLVIMAIGFRPDVRLAQAAGLAIGQTGAIKVDETMCTSDPDIYAAGDCVETTNLLTNEPAYVPYGSVANKQGRVVAVNACGGKERFPGVLGSAVCKVFDYSVARTGLREKRAIELGYDLTTVLVPAPDREHFMPNARMLLLKLVVDGKTRKLLGAQAVGPGMGEKRIELAAVAITAGMTVDQIANLDLCYAPPYGPVMDNLITAANVARNKLDGHMVGVTPMEVHRKIQNKEDFIFLDVRTPAEYDQVRLPGSTLITLGTLRSRFDELDKDKEIITFGRISLRGYEAALVLKAAGFKKVRVLDGGVEMWPYDKLQ